MYFNFSACGNGGIAENIEITKKAPFPGAFLVPIFNTTHLNGF